jgi:hypothetical protein
VWQRQPHRRRLPTILTKGAGGLTWRVVASGAAGRPRPLLLVIPPPERGAIEGGGRISPRASARGAGGTI